MLRSSVPRLAQKSSSGGLPELTVDRPVSDSYLLLRDGATQEVDVLQADVDAEERPDAEAHGGPTYFVSPLYGETTLVERWRAPLWSHPAMR